jgi:hypothetical protein
MTRTNDRCAPYMRRSSLHWRGLRHSHRELLDHREWQQFDRQKDLSRAWASGSERFVRGQRVTDGIGFDATARSKAAIDHRLTKLWQRETTMRVLEILRPGSFQGPDARRHRLDSLGRQPDGGRAGAAAGAVGRSSCRRNVGLRAR